MSTSSRRLVAQTCAVVAGAVLFFLVFAAVFVGAWPLLLALAGAYAAAGAIVARASTIGPRRAASALALPGAPIVLTLLPGAVVEAGLARALLWPAMLGVAWCLAWLGGILVRGTRRV